MLLLSCKVEKYLNGFIPDYGTEKYFVPLWDFTLMYCVTYLLKMYFIVFEINEISEGTTTVRSSLENRHKTNIKNKHSLRNAVDGIKNMFPGTKWDI